MVSLCLVLGGKEEVLLDNRELWAFLDNGNCPISQAERGRGPHISHSSIPHRRSTHSGF